METPRTEPQPCCYDGQLTDDPIKVDEVHTSSGAGRDVIACPAHAPMYGVSPDRQAS